MSNTSSGSLSELLRKRGYQILGIGQKESVIVRQDGREHLGESVAEYTVSKNGKRYVVWGMRGEEPSDPTEPALRRRLIELDRAFGLNGILLVDPGTGKISEVSFKYPRERDLDLYFHFFGALFIVALVIGIIWLMVAVRLF
ncbi:MAG: hypothetical protein JW873_03875 [Candidatus Saganbacteria bacterium]|nr:hypothetical protein [Candidatus Saganbacteria bacterium]